MMIWKQEWKALMWLGGLFAALYYLPIDTLRSSPRVANAAWEALALVHWYAREHVLLCLIPAFFIAGAVGVFINQGAVLRYLGADASRILAYGVAAVSGTVLAVCSCTVLPLFASIHRRGAGLGPATAFLYSGPAINVLAIILTARVLGPELGIARAVGAVAFSVVIGLAMHFVFRREERERSAANRALAAATPPPAGGRPLVYNAALLAALVAILVFATWAPSGEPGLWRTLYLWKWVLTGLAGAALALMLVAWMGLPAPRVVLAAALPALLALARPDLPLLAFAGAVVALGALTSTADGEAGEWFSSSWDFAKQILPLLFIGVVVAGALLGRPGHEGLIPAGWVSGAVGGNSLAANAFAAVVGAFMYFATLTEVPILQGLLGNGMGAGPALALLLAGPALSLPNMLVIRQVMGTRRMLVFVALVVVMATLSGMVFGTFFPGR